MPDVDPQVGRALEAREAAVAVTRNIRTAEGESITQRVVAQQPAAKPPTVTTSAAAGGGAGGAPPREKTPIATVQPPPQVQRIIENVQRLREVSEQLITTIKSGDTQGVAKVIQQVQIQAQTQAGAGAQSTATPPSTTGVAVAVTRGVKTAGGESITQRIVAQPPVKPPTTATGGGGAVLTPTTATTGATGGGTATAPTAAATGGRALPTIGVAVAVTRNIKTAEGESITGRIVQHATAKPPTTTTGGGAGGGGGAATQWVSYKIPGTDITVNVPSNLASQFESLSPAKQYMIYSTLSATHQLTNYNAWVNALSWGQVMSEKSAEQATVASIAAKGGDKAVEQFKSALNEYKAAKSDPSSPTVTITVTGTATGATPQFNVPGTLQQEFNDLVNQLMYQEHLSQEQAMLAAARALGIQVTYPTVTVTGAITLANPNAIDSGLYNNLISLGSKGDTRAFSQLWGQTFERAAQLAKQGNYDQAYLLLNTLTQAYNYLVKQGVIVNGIFAVPNAINSGLPQWDLAINARNQLFNYINGQGFSSFMSWVNKQLADAVQSGNATQAAALVNAAVQALNDLKQRDPSLYQSINGDKLLSQLQSSGSQAVALATVNAYISSYTSAPDAISKEAIVSGLIQFLNDLKAKDPTVFNAINGDQLLTQAQQGFAGAVYSYVNTLLRQASANSNAALNAANSGNYETALNHADAAVYLANAARGVLEALVKDPTVTDPNVKAAVANALQGVGALVNQLQGLRFSIQVNQAYAALNTLINQYNAAARNADPVAIYQAASALVNYLNALKGNPRLYAAVDEKYRQVSNGTSLNWLVGFLQQGVLNDPTIQFIANSVSSLQARLGVSQQVAEAMVLSGLGGLAVVLNNLQSAYYVGLNPSQVGVFDRAWEQAYSYVTWLHQLLPGYQQLSQLLNQLPQLRRDMDAYAAVVRLLPVFTSAVDSEAFYRLNDAVRQYNQTGDGKQLTAAQQYAQQVLQALNQGGVTRQAVLDAINAVQQSNLSNKQQVLQGLQGMLQFYDVLSYLATGNWQALQQMQQVNMPLLQPPQGVGNATLAGVLSQLPQLANDSRIQQLIVNFMPWGGVSTQFGALTPTPRLNVPDPVKPMLLQYMAAEKNSDYLTYRVAEWLSTLPEPARVALGFAYGMGEWLNKMALFAAGAVSTALTLPVSFLGGLLLPLGLTPQVLTPTTNNPNLVLKAATEMMNLPYATWNWFMRPIAQMSQVSQGFALATPSVSIPDSPTLRTMLSILGVDYTVAKDNKGNAVIKLDPVSFGNAAASVLFFLAPVAADALNAGARLAESLADPGGLLAAMQRVGAPDALINAVGRLTSWVARDPMNQAAMLQLAYSLNAMSESIRTLDFFTPIFDEVVPYIGRALQPALDAVGRVSPRLQEMALNAANRVLANAPEVAYPSAFVNLGLRWLVGADIGFMIGSQVGRAIPLTLGPEWSSTYNEWMKQWLFGIVGALIGGGVAAFGTPGLIREVYALTGDPATGDLLASAFERADNLGIRGIPAQVTIALAAFARAPDVFLTRLSDLYLKWRGAYPGYDDLLTSIRDAVEDGIKNAKAGKAVEGGFINPTLLDAVRAQAENLVLHGYEVDPGDASAIAYSLTVRLTDGKVETLVDPRLAAVIAEQVRDAVMDGVDRGLALRGVLVDLSAIRDVNTLDAYFQDSLTRYLSNYLGRDNAELVTKQVVAALKRGDEEGALAVIDNYLRPGISWLRQYRDALAKFLETGNTGYLEQALNTLSSHMPYNYPGEAAIEQGLAAQLGTARGLPPEWEVNIIEDYIDEYFNARRSLLEGVRPPTAGVKPQAKPQVFQSFNDPRQAADALYDRLNQLLGNAPDDVRNAVSPIIEELRGVQNPGDLDLALAQLREELGRLSVSNPDAMQFIIAVETLLKDFEYANRDLLYPIDATAAANVLRGIADKAPDAVKPELEKAVDALSRGDPGALTALVSALKEQAKADPSVLPILDVASELQQRLTPPPSAVTAGLTAAAAMQQPPTAQQAQAPPQAAQPTQPAVAGTGGALAAQLMMQPQANVEALLKQLPQLNQSPETVEQLKKIFTTASTPMDIRSAFEEMKEKGIINVFKSLGITPKVFVNALEKAGYPVPDAIKDAAASSNTWEEFFEKIRNILPERQPEEYYTEEAQKPGWTGPSGPSPPVRPRQPGEVGVGVPMAPRGSARELAAATGEYAAAPGAPTATAPYTVGRFPGMPTIELMPLVVGIPPIPAIYVSQLTQQQYGQATTTTTTGPPAEMPQQPPELVGPGVVPTPTGFLWPITQAGAGQRPGRKTRGVYEVLTI